MSLFKLVSQHALCQDHRLKYRKINFSLDCYKDLCLFSCSISKFLLQLVFAPLCLNTYDITTHFQKDIIFICLSCHGQGQIPFIFEPILVPCIQETVQNITVFHKLGLIFIVQTYETNLTYCFIKLTDMLMRVFKCSQWPKKTSYVL